MRKHGSYANETAARRRAENRLIRQTGIELPIRSPEVALFEAAQVLMAPRDEMVEDQRLAMNVARRCGAKRARLALARRPGIVLHRMRVDKADFSYSRPA
jgi:hypothetical protein